MSDHDSGYAMNAAIGRLYLEDAVFQARSFEEQQAFVLYLLEQCHSDANLRES